MSVIRTLYVLPVAALGGGVHTKVRIVIGTDMAMVETATPLVRSSSFTV